jgi:hypothetical protein
LRCGRIPSEENTYRREESCEEIEKGQVAGQLQDCVRL